MDPADRALVQIIDAAVAESHRLSGEWVNCRAGCSHCCHGPFTVTSIDLARLREGLDAAPPDLAARIRHRAAEARNIMRPNFPGDWPSGVVSSQADADAFDLLHPWLPCPVLDVESGACTLHAHRPVACRLHGSAIRLNGLDLRHCSLNYTSASLAQIESCRVPIAFSPPDLPSHLSYIAWAAL